MVRFQVVDDKLNAGAIPELLPSPQFLVVTLSGSPRARDADLDPAYHFPTPIPAVRQDAYMFLVGRLSMTFIWIPSEGQLIDGKAAAGEIITISFQTATYTSLSYPPCGP